MEMEAMMSSLIQDIAPSETITTEVIDKIADIVSNIMKYRRNEGAKVEEPHLSELQKRIDISNSAASFSVNGSHHNTSSLNLPYTPRDPIKENYSLEDFQCKYCLRPFFSRRELSKHVELNHFTDLCFSCSICTKVYQSDIELSGHMQCTHGSIIDHTSRVCKFCDRKFEYALQLSNHLKKYHIPTSECRICRLKCNTIPSLWEHMLRYHDMNPSKIECNLCLECSDTPEEYHEHQIRAHAFPCMECSVSTSTKLGLCQHLDNGHGKHHCLQCYEVFDMIEEYIDHGIANHPEDTSYKPLYCPFCNGRFEQFSAIQDHLYSRGYFCTFCDCVTKTCHLFQLHLKTAHQMTMRYSSDLPSSTSQVPLDNLSTLVNTASTRCSEPDKDKFSPFRLNPTIIFHPALTQPKPIKEEPQGFQSEGKGKQSQAFSAGEADRSKDAASYIHNLITVNESLLSMKPSPLTIKYNMEMYQEDNKSGFRKGRPSPPSLVNYESEHAAEGDEAEVMSNNEDMASVDTKNIDSCENERSPRDDERKSESDTPSSDESSSQSSGVEGRKLKDKKDPYKSLRSLNINSKTMRLKHRKIKSCSSITEEQKDIVVAECHQKKEDFTCLVCSRKFVSQGLLSRHWGNPQQCYICSVTVCDVKILNDHMRTVHSETF